ncbi:DUF4097 family beta strand repeat-containing protein [Paenibacillus sp. CMAA1364]
MRNKHNIRIGRYTATLLLMVTGILLIIDYVEKSEYLVQMPKWWPLLIISWGIESILIYVCAGTRRKTTGYSLRLDLKGMILSILLTASVFIVSQQAQYMHLWSKVGMNLPVASIDYSEQEGGHFNKDIIEIPVHIDTENIMVNNINGNVRLHREAIDNIQISTEVWVDQIDGPETEAIFDQSTIEVSEGPTISIEAKGKVYGQSGKRQPRMNLSISLPENRRFNYEIRTMNGNIILHRVEAIEGMKIESANGMLEMENVLGNVQGKTVNGIVRIRNLEGNVDITSNQGNMLAIDTSGALRLSTQVGNISLLRANGDVDITTKNGNMYVSEPMMNLKAETLNGSVKLNAQQIGGDWDVYSAVGIMDINLPYAGNYKLSGSISFGDITSTMSAFTIYNNKIWGTVGEGDYSVRIQGNSDLNVNQF